MKTVPAFLLVLLSCLLAATVKAQFDFTTNGDTLTLLDYTGPGGAVVIPSATNGLPVTSIGDQAFYGFPNVTGITIPRSITSIGDEAFGLCGSLTGVSLPNSVTNLGAFAFYNTGLTNIVIPDTVTRIGSDAFFDCSSLTNITVGAQNANYSAGNGILFNENQTTILEYPAGMAGSYTIPNGVTSIGEDAFYACSGLTGVTIPNSVTNIGYEAFEYCASLTSIVIPNSVTGLGEYAFALTGLESVYFTGNVPVTGSSSFLDDAATIYYLPGTTGWGPAFNGLPAVLWNPTIQTANSSFGVHTNQFGFTITGTANIPIVVAARASLSNPVWVPLQTCLLTNGSIYFSDPQWMNYPGRFYRISSP